MILMSASFHTEKEDSFSMGYKDFGYIHNLYGDLVLFYDGNYFCILMANKNRSL